MQAGDGVDDGQVVRIRLAFGHGPFYLQIAEAVVGETGLPGLPRAITSERVFPIIRFAGCLLVRGTVGIKEFGGDYSYYGAAGAGDGEPRYAGGILAKVVYPAGSGR